MTQTDEARARDLLKVLSTRFTPEKQREDIEAALKQARREGAEQMREAAEAAALATARVEGRATATMAAIRALPLPGDPT